MLASSSARGSWFERMSGGRKHAQAREYYDGLLHKLADSQEEAKEDSSHLEQSMFRQ